MLSLSYFQNPKAISIPFGMRGKREVDLLCLLVPYPFKRVVTIGADTIIIKFIGDVLPNIA